MVAEINSSAPANETRRLRGLDQLAQKIESDALTLPKFVIGYVESAPPPEQVKPLNAVGMSFLSPFEKASLGFISHAEAEIQQAAKLAADKAKAQLLIDADANREQLRREEDARQGAIYAARENTRFLPRDSLTERL
jgi:hypothetical protein